MIVATGDPLGTNAYVFAHNGGLGCPVARQVRLPKDLRGHREAHAV